MIKSPWFWLGILVVLVLLVWLWHRHRRKVIANPQSIGTPLHVQATAPPPTSIFSTISKDAAGVESIFGGVSSIFSGGS